MINFLFSFNWIDLILLGLLIYFILTNSGFIGALFEIVGLFVSSILSFKFYPFIAPLLINQAHFSSGIANAVSFILLWILTETLFYIGIHFILKSIPIHFFTSKINYVLGIVPAIFQALIFFTFIVTSLIALPVRGTLKKDVLSSRTAPVFLNISQMFESKIRSVFNDAIAESLNFITIKPSSDERIDLGFTLDENQLAIDFESEKQMIALVNNERTKRGFDALVSDSKLQMAARAYAKTMFQGGFFSHESSFDHTSPAKRLDNAGIDYLIMGENLAYAPDVIIAHNGLMNSEGHRKNILSPEFGHIGVGVIDGGIYGKMFVQEFTN